MKKIKIKKKGFSLIEILISMAIMALGLATITILMVNNIKNTRQAKERVVAMGLAQEAIEIFRNFKENEPTFKSESPVKANGDYVVDTTTLFSALSDKVNKQLYLPSSGGFYTHTETGNAPSKYFRKVVLLNDSTKKQIEITSYVSWNESGSFSSCNIANKCISVSTVMPD